MASTSGAQTQMHAFGTANLFVNTEDPKATLFRREHTPLSHFAVANVSQTISGTPAFGNRIGVEFDRPADLIGNVAFKFTLLPWFVGATAATTVPDEDVATDNFAYCDNIGYAMIEQFEVVVGNNRFEVSDGQFMNAMDELCLPEGRQAGSLTGKIPSVIGRIEAARNNQELIIPIWCDFFQDPGKALEAVAIHKQKIRLNFTFRPLTQLIHIFGASGAVNARDAYIVGLSTPTGLTAISPNAGSANMSNATLEVNYIWLTSGERDIILRSATHILYLETQKILEIDHVASEQTLTTRMSGNNICHDMIILPRLNSKWDYTTGVANQYTYGYEWFDYSGVASAMSAGTYVQDAISSVRFTANNTQRFDLSAKWLGAYIPRTHYARSPENGMLVYNFAQHPVDPDPTGGFNLSMIDHQELRFTFPQSWTDNASGTVTPLTWDGKIFVYLRTWNVATRARGVLHKELSSQ